MQSDEEIEIATDGHDNHVEAESLIEPPSTLHTMDDPPQQRHIRRKEVEARHFDDVKQALLRRLGPTKLIEVHEQAHAQLRLTKGQSIRELSQEVQRLIKKVYPDVNGSAQDRLAVKSLLQAVPDNGE